MNDAYHAIKDPIAYAGQTALVWVFGNQDVIKNAYQTLSPQDKIEADLTFC
jgi:hypothetical protein